VSLELIVGPPNSGRAGALLDRFDAAVEREPVLVVPTSDDVSRFERELCGRPGRLLGGTVTSFPGLFREVAAAIGSGTGTPLSRMQRVWLARAAARSTRLRILRRSAEREGFAPALEALLADLQASGLDSASFEARVDELEDGSYEAEIALLFSAYERLRDRLGLPDEHLLASAATASLRAEPRRWRGRPVLLYGFDDLAREQVELLAALAGACEVTVALVYEDRPALAARAELLGVLRDELGGEVVAELEPDREHTDSATLFHLERNLFEVEPETAPSDGALRLLESAGDRSEAELIGRRIARLIASGTDPDEIAIAVRNPDRQAPLLARVLGSLGIPAAAEARVALGATATGSTLLRLLAIANGSGTAADVLACLRGPGRAPSGKVDWFERQVRRNRLETAEQALAAWRERGERDIWALEALEEADGNPAALAGALSRIAADVAEKPHRRVGLTPSADEAVELRAAAEVSRALGETAELGAQAPGPAELAELLGHVRVPLWRGPTEGRVRILSPYRLRATRVSVLFVAGLIDGAFPAPGGAEPLLSDERRRGLGLAARRDPAAEERYLFHSCVSRPQHGLQLSYSTVDASGTAIARSPFVDEVRELLAPRPTPDRADDEVEREITDTIGIGDVAPAPEDASSPRDLARALAVLPPDAAEPQLAALELSDEVRGEVLGSLGRAREGIDAAAQPGPLALPAVLEALAERDLYGASTLEEYDTCSYRWFVGHELAPRPIEPDPEPLETGGIAHAALEALYRHPPGGPRPTEETLEAWIGAARDRLRECARDRGWDLESAGPRISLARLDAVLARFLGRDATTGGPMQPDPELLEAAFGDGEEDQHPPADLGTFKLHGRIDRIDVSTDRKALIRDYKLSRKVTAAARLIQDGRLQLPLYMEAVRGMGLEPIGGLYHPLAATKDEKTRPRGLLAKDHRGALIPGETEAHVRSDFLEQEEFDQLISDAAERAREIVAGMRSGRVVRDPRDGKCPTWCGFAPICRMERGAVLPDEEEDEAQ
jgi:ATP-dependent helicase/DNAse subunit B